MIGPGNDLLQAAAALAPASVLRLLADVAASGADDPPVVTIHLSGGQVLDGAVVRVGADRGAEAVVLAGRQAGQLGYALLDSVVAVELHNPRPFQDVLTEGRLPSPVAGQPVTRLALQREFAATADFPVSVDWEALTGSDRLLGNLARLLGGLREAITQVRADEFGRRAWDQAGPLRVEHRTGARMSVHRTADGLSVHADLLAALPRALAGELHREISALL